MVKPGTERTFSEYAADSFIPYIRAQLPNVTRLDIVWDEYLKNSLKATTRGKRGTGVRQRVAADNNLPRNWQEFLRVDQNKQELFKYLAECVTSRGATPCPLFMGKARRQQSTHGSLFLRQRPPFFYWETHLLWSTIRAWQLYNVSWFCCTIRQVHKLQSMVLGSICL